VFALAIKAKMNWDDSLDVIAVHLVGGIVGTLLLGLFADAAVNGDSNGLLFGGGFDLLQDQFVAASSVAAFSFVMTYLIATAIQRTLGLRISEDDENLGLDQSQHAESAYTS